MRGKRGKLVYDALDMSNINKLQATGQYSSVRILTEAAIKTRPTKYKQYLNGGTLFRAQIKTKTM